jgi:hypothetical protein
VASKSPQGHCESRFSTSGAEMAVVSMGECPFPGEIHRLVTQIKSK